MVASSSTAGTARASFVRSTVLIYEWHVSQASTRTCLKSLAVYTASLCGSSSPHDGQRTRRYSQSVPQSAQIKKRFPPSPSGRSAPTCGLLPQKGQVDGVAWIGGL